ncbi:MAG TPA: hypothetical protein VEQ63_06880 [Bryobacteraceae bacterium]|nr:hypothetical protein [Bryobacteraceae bacterium]
MCRLPSRLGAVWLIFVFGVLVFRAKTQSFTIDEAFAFELYVDRDLGSFVRHYDACNHVLHTFLTWMARRALGSSELVLRLPSLLGALLYLSGVYRISGMVAGQGWLRTLGIVVLTSNPLILDFMVASRGYGLALGLFAWSLYYAVRWLAEHSTAGHLYRAGLLAGLAIGANLTFVVPAGAVGLVMLVLSVRRRWSGIWGVLERYAGPSATVAFLITVLPLAKARPDNFYFGSPSLDEATGVLWNFSLVGHPEKSIVTLVEARCGNCISNHRRAILTGGASLLLAAAVFASTVSSRTAARFAWERSALVISGASLAASILLLVLLNRWAGALFPFGRTGLYLLFLALIAMFAATAAAEGWARTPGYLMLGVLSITFALQMESRSFLDWKFDQGTKQLVRAIAEDQAKRGLPRFRVAASWVHERSTQYYRKRNKLHSMDPVIITSDLGRAPADYYVLNGDDRKLVSQLALRVLSEDTRAASLSAARR